MHACDRQADRLTDGHRGSGSKLEVGEHEFRHWRRKKIFLCPPFCRAPKFGGMHTPGWAQRWAVIAHCLFAKKWPKNLVCSDIIYDDIDGVR